MHVLSSVYTYMYVRSWSVTQFVAEWLRSVVLVTGDQALSQEPHHQSDTYWHSIHREREREKEREGGIA